MLDVQGLLVSVAVGGALSIIGQGIDNLLLERHSKWFNTKSIEWWSYFDNIDVVDVPRRGLQTFLTVKQAILGSGTSSFFLLRTAAVSVVLTVIAIFGGTWAGLYLHGVCSGQHAAENLFVAAWRIVGGAGHLSTISAINVLFDIVTIVVTAYLIGIAVRSRNYTMGALVAVDIAACAMLIESLLYFTDVYRNVRLSHNGFGTALHQMYVVISNANCAIGVLLFPAIFYSLSILLPTLIYMVIIVVIFILRETFLLMRWFVMHILEKSSEDAKKTIFTHLGTTLGMMIVIGKAAVEIAKL